MLNSLISLSLESLTKPSSPIAALLPIGGKSAVLGSYPVLRSALLRAERRGSLESERRTLVARLATH